jgi:hypothetical protein
MKTPTFDERITCSKAMVGRLSTDWATSLLSLLLLLVLPAAAEAQFYYTTNVYGTIIITGYYGPGGDLNIPGVIDGLPVTAIGEDAFYYYTNRASLTSVTIPDTVTSVGRWAFEGCTNLRSVTIGDGVNIIQQAAFADCWSLANVTIPDSVTSIGNSAFYRCTNLSSVTIGDNVTNIADETFVYCTSLTCVTIGNSVRSIGVQAFFSCASLTNVTIPRSVTSIAIGGNDSVVDFAFLLCTNLTAITVDALNPVYSSVDGVLFNKSQTTLLGFPPGKGPNFTIPEGVTSIGEYAFFGCTSVAEVTLPNTLTSIGNDVFEGSHLTRITIPDSVTSIGGRAFAACTNLTSVTIGDGVNIIQQSAFVDCWSLANVTIPDSTTSIGIEAFARCGMLACVTIGNSVTNLGDGAFTQCTSLTSVYFRGNAPSLGSEVFRLTIPQPPQVPPIYIWDPATIYYLPGRMGWGPTFGGRPTAQWIVPPPTIQRSPQTQTAAVGSTVVFQVQASGPLTLSYQWYRNFTNLMSLTTVGQMELSSVQFSQAGAYTVVITNLGGAVTSSPAMLQVIAPVQRRPVPGVILSGQAGSVLNVDSADSLDQTTNWTTAGSVSLTNSSQYYFDLSTPLPPQRFYRVWQTGAPSMAPSLDLQMVPAVTLTGATGGSVRLDYINQFGPINAWVTLNTVTLTNASQLYFDVTAPGQPPRLYRLVQVP